MMKYQPTTTPIPKDRRAEINEKILSMIDSGDIPVHITKEDIFNAYTGIGGLHGLDRQDYKNYYDYAQDKREFEQGQFFTAAGIIDMMVKDLHVQPSDTVCDLACGAGAFFNHFKEEQCYGCDIDHKAIRVAKYLYPGSNVEYGDMAHYDPGLKMDFVVGNPPFSLRIGYNNREYLSQHLFVLRAGQILKPGGVLICIVPDSYLKDEFFTKGMIAEVEEHFSFLFQYTLPAGAFRNMGVETFNTKVIAFQRLADSITPVPYSSTYIEPEAAGEIMAKVAEVRRSIRTYLHRELLKEMQEKSTYGAVDKYGQPIRTRFMEKVKKYLYEIKQHRVLQPHLPKALEKINEFNNQKWLDGMKYEDWQKIMLTENKVLGFLKRIMQIQNRKPIDTYRMVADKYGVRLKAYSKKAAIRMKKLEEQTDWRWNDLVLSGAKPVQGMTSGQKQALRRKQRAYRQQVIPWKDMQRDEKVDKYLQNFRFYNKEGNRCSFNKHQIHDLGLIMQKDFAILNWQQGTGKTAASAVWARRTPLRNTFVIGPAIAVNLTWEPFMQMHKKDYINVKSLEDVKRIQPGMFVLVSLDYVRKYTRQLLDYVKCQGHKVNLVFDESDEITNPHSLRTQAVLTVFRRCRRKLLATGTTTRNNITELYSQLELLYNNSVNITCFCSYIYKEQTVEDKDGNKSKEITKVTNDMYRSPFPPRGGSVLFKQCFNPAKTTVFGIQQHNQNIYNEDSLRIILEYTIITRKFKEICGDKYTVSNIEVDQHDAERRVYKKIITELNEILPAYFASTGNARKDAALRVVRQMQLLIDATSMPQNFKEYESTAIPNKALKVFQQIEEHNAKIAIGCTSLAAVEFYARQIGERYPFRPLFVVKGDVQFKKRGSITQQFETTENGILVCTQQSLKSSVNIPTCSRVLLESKQWNIPKIEQFFFRFIRYDSPNHTDVVFLSYRNTIEVNLMALLLVKERLNDYIKTLEYREESDIYDEYGVDLDILNSLITKEKDSEGQMKIKWGEAGLVV